MRLLVFGIQLWSVCLNAHAQDIVPANDRSLANSTVARPGVSSLFSNPAGLTAEKKFTFLLSAVNHFTLQEFNSEAIGLVIPLRQDHTAGISFSHSGIPAMRRMQSGISYAVQLHPKISGGIRLNYRYSQVAGHPEYSTSLISGDAGLLFEPVRNMQAGIKLINPERSAYRGDIAERAPSEITFGISRKINEQVWLGARASKATDHATVASLGIEYNLLSNLTIRFGESSCPWLTCLGFGYRFQRIHFDLSAELHQELGLTSACMLEFQLGSK